jgi:hypothetical protein
MISGSVVNYCGGTNGAEMAPSIKLHDLIAFPTGEAL